MVPDKSGTTAWIKEHLAPLSLTMTRCLSRNFRRESIGSAEVCNRHITSAVPKMNTTTLQKAQGEIARDKQIHQAIESALKNLEDHAGQEGFRHLYDKAIHILVAIDQAGL